MISFSFTSVSVIGESGGTKQYTEFIAKSIQLYVKKLQNGYKSRPVVPGCARCAMAHPDFGRSVNPIATRGTDYAHLITTGTPGFSDLPTTPNYNE